MKLNLGMIYITSAEHYWRKSRENLLMNIPMCPKTLLAKCMAIECPQDTLGWNKH